MSGIATELVEMIEISTFILIALVLAHILFWSVMGYIVRFLGGVINHES